MHLIHAAWCGVACVLSRPCQVLQLLLCMHACERPASLHACANQLDLQMCLASKEV
jgi:hypothetical protein